MGKLIRIGQVVAAALALSLLPAAAPAAASPRVAAPQAAGRQGAGLQGTQRAPAVPALAWSPCGSGGFECATARVPLDYRQPDGQSIDIAVIRHPATDPAHRIGSVFFNPGGPGGSGVQALPLVYQLFPAQVRARFDIVSFDPRGVGASTAVQCYPSLADEQQALAGLPPAFPVGRSQEQAWERIFAAFDRTCGAADGELLRHLSTANVARDMDLLRQAVGDRQLSYLGVSYGTYLGATYANLFPGHVRALVLDGNIDPVAWVGGDGGRRLAVTLRLGQDEGMAATLTAFLRLCGQAAVSACAFSAGTPAATAAKYQTLLQRLRRQPVTLGGTVVGYPLTVALTGASLYTATPSLAGGGWPQLAAFLQELWAASSGTPARPVIVPGHGMLPVPPPGPLLGPAAVSPAAGTAVSPAAASRAAASPYTGPEQDFAPLCADSPNPRDQDSYARQAAFGYARSGAFGWWRTWAVEPCAVWPALDPGRYTGPWNRPTANPVLLVGNTTDPATPYAGSLAMARDLARARLLTVDGYGHTALLNPSTCASDYEAAYLISGSLPPPGTVCQQDQQPFAG
jgi:pimeloyl-ACP methyl ester carboxylesterase